MYRIEFDVWFEDDKLENILKIVEYIELDGSVLYDRRRDYPDGIKGSRFGGLLCSMEISDEVGVKLCGELGVA